MNKCPSIQSQQGGATLFVVLLAGLGAVAIAISMMSRIGGAQKQALTVNAITQSQSRAWVAVEAIRVYLQGLSSADLALVNGSITLTGLSGARASVVSNVADGTDRRVTVNVFGVGNAATSIVQAIIVVTPGAAGSTLTPGSAVTIASGLLLNKSTTFTGGTVTLNGGSTTPSVLVEGNLTDSALAGGVNVCATGDLTVGYGGTKNNVCTNGNLTIIGDVTGIATAAGNVLLNGGGAVAGTINANGDVTMSAANYVGVVNTQGNVTVNKGSIGTINAMGDVIWTSTGSGATAINANGSVDYAARGGDISSHGTVRMLSSSAATNVSTTGDLILGGWGTAVGNIQVGGSVNMSTSEPTVSSGQYGGNLTTYLNYTASWHGWNPGNNTNSTNAAVRIAGFSPSVPTVSIPSVSTTFSVPSPTVDANQLRTLANYAFYVDGMGNKKVDVKNVNGILDGTYFIGNYAARWWPPPTYAGGGGFLCTSASGGFCTSPSTPGVQIMQGSWAADPTVITYSGGDWTLGGAGFNMLGTGIMWFEGNVKFANGGVNGNTVIATGNINEPSGGGLDITAPNVAGFSRVCQGTTYYPTQLCNMGTSTYNSLPIGNVALLAGSYSGSTYVGGQITMVHGQTVSGAVLAGDTFSGSGTVNGIVSSSGSGTGSKNYITGLTLNLSNTSSYTTTVIPCMLNCGSTPAAASSAKLFWSRYQ